MPKNKILRQIINVEVRFKAGDVLKPRGPGRHLLIIKVTDNHTALLDQKRYTINGNIVNVRWHTDSDEDGSYEYILGSELSKSLYGGQGSLRDLTQEYTFKGSDEITLALEVI